MDKLKDHINRSSIPEANTPPGHRERFENKLLSKEKKPFFNQGNPFWMYAAAVLLVLLIGTFAWNWQQEQPPQTTMGLADVSFEFAEMERYFQHQIEEHQDIKQSNDSLVNFYMADLRRLENEHEFLETQLSKSFGNERVINALINNYKTRLTIMEKLRRYIKIKESRKNEQNA